MNEMKNVITDEEWWSLKLNECMQYRKCKKCKIWYHVDYEHKCTHYSRYLGSILDPRD